MALALIAAWAAPSDTAEAIDRVEELLELRLDDGSLAVNRLSPLLVVSLEPRYEGSTAWFATRALQALTRAFGEGSVRVCEACMAPRTWVEDGRLSYQTGALTLDEIAALDERLRGDAPPARAAAWFDEHRGGVSLRVVDLKSGHLLFAQNVDPSLTEFANTTRVGTLGAELERRAKGEALAQTFVDLAVYPGQHVSLDFTDQFGKRNENFAGFTLSLFDPVLGVGASYHRRVPFFNATVGGKAIISLPTSLISTLAPDDNDFAGLDPLLTVAGTLRVPFGRSNYGLVVSASTNGQIGAGLSLMNIRLLPVLP